MLNSNLSTSITNAVSNRFKVYTYNFDSSSPDFYLSSCGQMALYMINGTLYNIKDRPTEIIWCDGIQLYMFVMEHDYFHSQILLPGRNTKNSFWIRNWSGSLEAPYWSKISASSTESAFATNNS